MTESVRQRRKPDLKITPRFKADSQAIDDIRNRDIRRKAEEVRKFKRKCRICFVYETLTGYFSEISEAVDKVPRKRSRRLRPETQVLGDTCFELLVKGRQVCWKRAKRRRGPRILKDWGGGGCWKEKLGEKC